MEGRTASRFGVEKGGGGVSVGNVGRFLARLHVVTSQNIFFFAFSFFTYLFHHFLLFSFLFFDTFVSPFIPRDMFSFFTVTFLSKRLSENSVLRRIFGSKSDEVTGEWRKLHSEELNDL